MYLSFQGTDAEFIKVARPTPTQECIESRVSSEDRCNEDFEARVGAPEGVCDEPSRYILKVITGSLYDVIYDPSVPEAIRSPAYDVLDLFRISELQLGELFNYWYTKPTPRDAVCQWAVENIEYLRTFVPRSYPRVLRE